MKRILLATVLLAPAPRFTIDGVPFTPCFETYGRNSVYLRVTMK